MSTLTRTFVKICTEIVPPLSAGSWHKGRRDAAPTKRTQCQFSAHRRRLRNYLDKPLGVTIKRSSPPPTTLFVVFGALWIYSPTLRRRLGKNVLLIYLVKGLKDGGVREVIIPELPTLADEFVSLDLLFEGECRVN